MHPFGGKDYIGIAQVMQYLVRADGVERGEAVKQRDDDLHDAPLGLDGTGVGTRRGSRRAPR